MVRFSAILFIFTVFASHTIRPHGPLNLPIPPSSAQQPAAITNEDILSLVEAGISPEIVVAKIKTSNCRFDTSPSEIIALKQRGVPESVILAMVQAVNLEKRERTVSNESTPLGVPKENVLIPPKLSPEILAERAHRDSICAACKFIFISYVDSKTGVVTDDWVSKDQLSWLKSMAAETEKGKRQAKFLFTKHRENADYILFWTQAEGFIPYVTYVPRTETTTSNVSGNYSTTGTNGYGFGTVIGNIVVTRTYYEAQANEWQFVDASLTVFDSSGKNVYETKHRGKYRWSKPEKDCLVDAYKYLRQLLE